MATVNADTIKAEKERIEQLDKKLVDLIVNPKYPLPHSVTYQGKKYEFKPTCKVPGGFAEGLLKSSAHVFSEYKGEKIDNSLYKWRPEVQNTEFMEQFKKLSSDQKEMVLDFMADVASGKGTPAKPDKKEPAEKPKPDKKD